jgi:shikimate kinase
MHCALIGYRSAGKTTIGRAVAAEVGAPFCDLDDSVLAELGCSSVIEAWESWSEGTWREAERRCLKRILSEEPQVIALGGGVPIDTAAASLIEEARCRGTLCVIYLSCSVDRLTERLGEDEGDRPPLLGECVAAEVAEMMAVRHPIYQSIADIEIDADTDDIDAVVFRVVEEISRSPWASDDGQGDASG